MSTIARRLLASLRLAMGWRRISEEEREMRAELLDHLDRSTEKNIRAGMSPDAARRAAVVAFGGVEQIAEAARDELRSRPLDDLMRDLSYGVRTLRRAPAFAAIAIATLALGVAATVTVFSFVDAIYLRALDVPNGGRLVRVYLDHIGVGALGYDGFRLVRQRVPAFDEVVAHYSTAPLYTRAGELTGELSGAVVSASYFSALGIRPALGRFFTAAEDAVPDRDFIAVIGYDMWQRWFGGDRAVIGRSLSINGLAFTIIGVAPERFGGVLPYDAANELWIPMMQQRVGYRWCDGFKHDCQVLDVMARLAPGATLAQARSQVSVIAPQLLALTEIKNPPGGVTVERASGVPERNRREKDSLARLLSVIGLTLLVIACANLAGLLLARGVAREREMAVRTSLGASRQRIVRQLLAESLIIALAGAAAGTVVATWAARLLVGYFSSDGEGHMRHFNVSPDVHWLVLAVALVVATTLMFGLFPALATARADQGQRLRGGRGANVSARARLMLVATQTGFSLALLIGAALLARSVDRIMSGAELDSSHMAMLRLRPRLVKYDSARAEAFLHRVFDRIRAMPEVTGLAYARGVGLVWGSTGTVRVVKPTDAPVPPDRQMRVSYHEVSPGYFAAFRVPVLRGREFTDHDDVGSPRVAVVNETLARRLWSGNAVGESVELSDTTFQVVGVVRDYRPHHSGEEAAPMAFVPFWQNVFEAQVDARLAVRVKGDPAVAIGPLRRAIAEVDAAVPVSEAMSMRNQVDDRYADLRLGRAMLIVAGGLALLLTAIGLYGVLAFLIERREREIGVRLAVGASPSSVAALIVAQAMRPIRIGALAGLATALAGSRLLSSWLYGVSQTDIASYAFGLGATVIVAAFASFVPARRAARVDPATALRAD
jgi:predicted permease